MKLALFQPPTTAGNLELRPAAKQIRDELIRKAEISICDAASRDTAVEVAREITQHLSDFDADTAEVKAPFLKICRDIDGLYNDHVAGLLASKKAIASKIGSFNAHEAEQRRMERERLQRQVEEEQRKLREAEAERRRVEEAQRVAEAQPTLDGLNEELELQAQKEQAEKEAREAREAQLKLQRDQEALRATAELEKPAGGFQRTEIDLEIFDIHALYRAYPECVKLEPVLSLIKAMIKAGKTLPGIKHTERPVFSTRR